MTPDKVVRILSIDGGGVRGIIPLHILKYLEDKTHKPIVDLFDVFIGTSTGAIIVVGITEPKKTAMVSQVSRMLELYTDFSGTIFRRPFWYKLASLNGYINSKYLPRYRNQLLEEWFPKVRLSELNKMVIIPAYSLQHEVPHLFSSWAAKKDAKKDYYVAPLLEGATSMLTIFPPMEVYNVRRDQSDVLTDSALYLDNPVTQGELIAKAIYPHKKYIIVSLGTGKHLYKMAHGKNLTEGHWGIIQSTKLLIHTAAHAASATANMATLREYESPNSSIVIYCRFNIDINPDHSYPFNATPPNIKAMNAYGKRIVQENKPALDLLARVLARQ